MSKNDNLPNEIVINGIKYVPKDTIVKMYEPAVDTSGLPYCIVRTTHAGVFAGYLVERNGKEVALSNARRIWYWEGAATLSELAMEGTTLPQKCKFPTPVDTIFLTEAIEIIPMTKKAQMSIAEVPVWKA